mmetsp:Transcript_29183/g.75111  ORF Transcript_29183/g.75111 Transcript_29183/m.75111 type:complete len:169 (-) Transcript_29183:283-789(-)
MPDHESAGAGMSMCDVHVDVPPAARVVPAAGPPGGAETFTWLLHARNAARCEFQIGSSIWRRALFLPHAALLFVEKVVVLRPVLEGRSRHCERQQVSTVDFDFDLFAHLFRRPPQSGSCGDFFSTIGVPTAPHACTTPGYHQWKAAGARARQPAASPAWRGRRGRLAP